MTTTWVLATTNSGKLAEFRSLLAGQPIALDAFEPGSYDAPDETGASFVENALIKARYAARMSGRPALADDSGLCVAALGGAPGIYSARYAGPNATDSQNVVRLLEELEGLEGERRNAEFHCVIVGVLAPDDPAPILATGCWPGRIARSPRGRHGFGYDPVFVDRELGLTAAELEPEQKNRTSHRARACRDLTRRLV